MEYHLKSNSLWWASEPPSAIVSGPRLIAAWTLVLFGQADPTSQQLQSLADLSKILWSQFTTRRDLLDRDYMSDEKHLAAYLSSFFIPNIERTRSALLEPRIQEKLKDLLALEQLDILDFGSGPLSASIGLLLTLGELASATGSETINTKKIKISAVERSEKAIKRAQSILAQCSATGIEITVERFTSIPANQKFNAVLAANVLNEIPEKHRMKTLLQLLDSLNTDGTNVALILEPGQEDHSRRLSSMRDELLQSKPAPHFRILAPCPHHEPCPLSPKTQRSDWCWFRTQFKAPVLLLELDRRSQVDHSSLAYSYLAVSKSESALERSNTVQPWAICVSDEMSVGRATDADKRYTYFSAHVVSVKTGESSIRIRQLASNGMKTKLCRSTGEYQSGLRAAEGNDETFQRGDVLLQESDFEALIQER